MKTLFKHKNHPIHEIKHYKGDIYFLCWYWCGGTTYYVCRKAENGQYRTQREISHSGSYEEFVKIYESEMKQ